MSGGESDAVEGRPMEVRDAAAGADDAPGLAREALRTLEVDFDRLAGPGGEPATRVVLDLRITGTVQVIHAPPSGG